MTVKTTMRLGGLVTATLMLAGCAGLEIRSLRSDEVATARSPGGAPLDGYVVYEPMVVVEVALKTVDGVKQCAAGKPFTLPDLSRPYLVRSKGGFGKAGVDVTITDGWQLGGIKDQSDNTAVLGALQAALGIKSATPSVPGSSAGSEPPCAPGLYRLQQIRDGEVRLIELTPYTNKR